MSVTDPYAGDPIIIDLGDGGDLYVQGGQPKMSSGIENAEYLSLFVDANWWGNDIDPANPGATGSRHFLAFIDRMPLTPGNLADAEKAADADLAWMLEDGLVTEAPTVVCSILAPGVCGVEITTTEPDGTTATTRWKLNWARMTQEIVSGAPSGPVDRSRYEVFTFVGGGPVYFEDGDTMLAKEQT